MRFIRDIYNERKEGAPVVSFEFFTPKTERGDATFFDKTLPELAAIRPGFCSVTYGAAGSTREKTLDMVQRIQADYDIPGMAHLTCVSATREELIGLLAEARGRGIANILALRGDPPAGADRFVRHPGGFRYAHELVTLARGLGGFSIGVAGFPEGHLECAEGKQVDWDRLKDKINCGADYVLTQLFFDNVAYYELRDYLSDKLVVDVPIVPGVIPILNTSQIRKFTALCGATIPNSLARRLESLQGDEAAAREFGIEFATDQCVDLLKHGAPGLHFYTLNKAYSTRRILENLRLA